MPSAIARNPLGEQVYVQILQRIHRGSIPAGSRLRDVAIAAELGVSRTPVREALLRLAREGFLLAANGKGFRLAPLDPAELREIGTILAALEPLALDQSPPEPGPGRLDRLTDIVRRLEQTRGDLAGCIEIDDDFHRVLLEDCPNRRLVDLVSTLRRSIRRYLHHYLEQGGRVSLSSLQHSKIADALRKGDRAGARQLLERKWRRGMDEIESALR
ncbi:MAG: GntR family transcriptional regulator [Gemmatimonadales bacterium]|nr:GntR family transcriptional regulator [Gemmatimonadales bacterium]